MMHTVDFALEEADLLLFMVDASKKSKGEYVIERIGDRPALLVLNKMDLIRQEDALSLVESYINQRSFDAVIPVSAKKGRNLNVLMSEIKARIPEGPPYYPPDMISEYPERFFVAELIRERIFEMYREEIPYSTQVNIVAYEERTDGRKDLIDAEIVVERPTQKSIIIGKKGEGIKRIGTTARKEIEAWLGRPVFLRLFVKVRENWRNQDGFLRSYGYQT
jgi:GTP-binding protein Era